MADRSGPLGGTPPRPAPSPNDFDLGPGQGAQFVERNDYLNSNEADSIRNTLNIPEQVSTLARNSPGHPSTQVNNIPEQPITFSEDDNTFFTSLGLGSNDEFNLPPVDHGKVESAIVIEASSHTIPFDGNSDPRLSAPADQGCPTPEQEATASNMQRVNHAHEFGNQHEQHNQQSDVHGLPQFNVLHDVQQYGQVQEDSYDPQQQQNFAPQQQEFYKSQQQHEVHHLKPQVFRQPPQGVDPSRKQPTQEEVQHQYVLQTLRQQLAYHEQLEVEYANKSMFHLAQHLRIREHLALKEQQARGIHNDNEDVPIDLLNTNFPKIGSPASLQSGVNTIGSSTSPLPTVFTGNSVDGAPTSCQATNATNYQANHVDNPQYMPNPSLPAQRSEHPETRHTMQPKRTADHFLDDEIAGIPDSKRMKTRGIFHGNYAQAHRPAPNEPLVHNPQPQHPPVIPSSLIDEDTQMNNTLPPSFINDKDQVILPLPPNQTGVLAAKSAITSTNPVITSGDTAGTAPTTKYKLKYKSAEECRNARALRHMEHDWIPPQNDTTIPRNDYERGGYVRQLVDAYTDITKCTDNQTSAGFKKRWAGLTTGDSIYTGQMIEIVCWKLLSIAEELHTVGPKSLRVSTLGKLKNIEKFKDTLFNERIDDICALLRASKWRCDRLMKFMEMNMTVATPKLMLRNSVQNKPQNVRRQKRLEVGRAIMKQKAEGLTEANNEGFMNVAQSNEAPNGGQFGNRGTNVQPAYETSNHVEETAQHGTQGPPVAYDANLNHAQPTANCSYVNYNNPGAFEDKHQAQPTQDATYPGHETAQSAEDQSYAQPAQESPYPGYEPAQTIHGQGYVQPQLGVPKVHEPHSQIAVATYEARATNKRRQSVLEDSNIPGEQSGPPSPKRQRIDGQSGEL